MSPNCSILAPIFQIFPGGMPPDLLMHLIHDREATLKSSFHTLLATTAWKCLILAKIFSYLCYSNMYLLAILQLIVRGCIMFEYQPCNKILSMNKIQATSKTNGQHVAKYKSIRMATDFSSYTCILGMPAYWGNFTEILNVYGSNIIFFHNNINSWKDGSSNSPTSPHAGLLFMDWSSH